MPETLDQLEAQLGDDLRALALEADPAWVRRVTAPRRRERSLVGPAIALAMSALAALVVAAALLVPNGQDDEGTGAGATGGTAQSESAGGAAPSGADSAGRASPAAPFAPGARAVERSAEATIATDDPQGAADELTRLTAQAGGFVASASVASGEGGGSGALTLRVPADGLDALLARLRDVGDVTALRREATDVTSSIASAERRLSDARDARAALRRALRRATDPVRIDALRGRLDRAGRLVERREAQLRSQRRRGALATVFVTLRAEEGGAWSPGDAPADALRVAGAVAGALLIALAAVSPLLALLVALALLRRLRRRGVLAG
jgi:hypothetical protein